MGDILSFLMGSIIIWIITTLKFFAGLRKQMNEIADQLALGIGSIASATLILILISFFG